MLLYKSTQFKYLKHRKKQKKIKNFLKNMLTIKRIGSIINNVPHGTEKSTLKNKQ